MMFVFCKGQARAKEHSWSTYKKLEELEDSFMGKYIKCISAHRVNNRQSVDFVFDQGIYSIKKAEEKVIATIRKASGKQSVKPRQLKRLFYLDCFFHSHNSVYKQFNINFLLNAKYFATIPYSCAQQALLHHRIGIHGLEICRCQTHPLSPQGGPLDPPNPTRALLRSKEPSEAHRVCVHLCTASRGRRMPPGVI